MVQKDEETDFDEEVEGNDFSEEQTAGDCIEQKECGLFRAFFLAFEGWLRGVYPHCLDRCS